MICRFDVAHYRELLDAAKEGGYRYVIDVKGGDGKAPGRIGAMIRDLVLPMMVRGMVASNSLSWMYDYRIDWPAPVVGAR